LARRRFENERRWLEKRGTWGDNPETLLWLLERLEKLEFTQCSLDRRRRAKLESRYVNVDLLLQRLRQAVYIVAEIESVPADSKLSKNTSLYTLDDYLVNVERHPISPEEVRRVLQQDLPRWVEEMALLASEGSQRHGYYLRQYLGLMIELRHLLTALIQLSDQWGL